MTRTMWQATLMSADLPAAGLCLKYLVAIYGDRPPKHPDAPRGMSGCETCGRVVFRGMGKWWES